MDFRMLNGAAFRVWKYFCQECKKTKKDFKKPENRLIRSGCAPKIAKELNYNPQTVTQSIHTLKEAGFLTEIKNPCDSHQSAYFMHVILIGECVPLPINIESLVYKFCTDESVASV